MHNFNSLSLIPHTFWMLNFECSSKFQVWTKKKKEEKKIFVWRIKRKNEEWRVFLLSTFYSLYNSVIFCYFLHQNQNQNQVYCMYFYRNRSKKEERSKWEWEWDACIKKEKVEKIEKAERRKIHVWGWVYKFVEEITVQSDTLSKRDIYEKVAQSWSSKPETGDVSLYINTCLFPFSIWISVHSAYMRMYNVHVCNAGESGESTIFTYIFSKLSSSFSCTEKREPERERERAVIMSAINHQPSTQVCIIQQSKIYCTVTNSLFSFTSFTHICSK